jgi:hypothetical protein
MEYVNFDLETLDYTDNGGVEQFRIRVQDSPVGNQKLSITRTIPDGLRQRLRCLENRRLMLSEMINLGEELADLLLPAPARTLLERSREGLEDKDRRLRIRLRFDTYALADLPWEYLYIADMDTPADQKGPDGFLALDHQISLVRYEMMGEAPGTLDPIGAGPLRVVSILASPPGLPKLKLDVEQTNIQTALNDLPDVKTDFYVDATMEVLEDALATSAHVFHFAGHGRFNGPLAGAIGGAEGQGQLFMLEIKKGHRRKKLVSAEKLALNLNGRGIRLAVLGACNSGRRDAINAWTGVAPALTKNAGIPAVIGMQYTIQDESTLVFNRRFYRALAAGETIDAAVSDGRIAIFNRGDEKERDWGVPVLYLRTNNGVLFPKHPQLPPGPPTSPAPTRGEVGLGTSTPAAGALRQCPKCQTPAQPGANFCANCGRRLTCLNCGKPILLAGNYCPQCGNPVAA